LPKSLERLLTRLLASASAGLLGVCGPAQAGPIQSLLGLPDWMELSVDYTTEPMGGMLGGLDPAATSAKKNPPGRRLTIGR
jgi:porin